MAYAAQKQLAEETSPRLAITTREMSPRPRPIKNFLWRKAVCQLNLHVPNAPGKERFLHFFQPVPINGVKLIKAILEVPFNFTPVLNMEVNC